MESIGQKLREARMQAGIPLEQASSRTKIRVHILEALESGEMERIPGGDVYTRNFLLSYARFLGMDVHAILAEFDQARPAVKERAKILESGSAPVRWTDTPPAFGLRRRDGARLWGAGLAALLLVAIAVVLVAWLGGSQGSGETTRLPAVLEGTPAATGQPRDQEPEPGVGPPGQGPSDRAEGQAPVSGLPAASPRGEPPVASPPARSDATVPSTLAFEPLVLRAVVEQRSWMRVDVDGRTEYTGILQAGQERSWTANDEIRVRFGYAQGVRLYLNGHDLGLAGEDVVTRSFTREMLGRLEGSR
ncbi:helix-turn-helix domain-containing protein [Limnochorda pilosa]|uniref:Cytoskeleton protein RodZ-like C-terminal domain-containing protein n=1 Tax=Limnochorda pilosa TaxID=1555112 RepID=A0A0K2SKR2_LIMPI|nr:helix-turn-helix domain-containing protein [Limnochorda pilosa]BAS27693.1 hypothetical protein LIP_1850 [Limnochorda pilosa]